MKEVGGTTVFFTLFLLCAIVWRVAETFRKQGETRGHVSMSWSFYGLFALSCVIFGGTAAEFFLVQREYNVWLAGLGLVMFVFANLLRRNAIHTLGRYWSLHIEIRERQPFVREGPYRYVRHPAYAAFVLEHIAVPLVGNAWWSLAVALLAYLPLILWRLTKEETALAQTFGEAYRAYQREVGALIPRLPAVRRSVS